MSALEEWLTRSPTDSFLPITHVLTQIFTRLQKNIKNEMMSEELYHNKDVTDSFLICHVLSHFCISV